MVAFRKCVLSVSILVAGGLQAGPYSGAAGTEGSDAVHMNSTEIVGWASGVAGFQRGPMILTDPEHSYLDPITGETYTGLVTYGEPEDALGAAKGDTYSVVSLGDGGWITLTFDNPLYNGPGWDFAVFENAFQISGTNLYFLELAFVEVSSNGIDFFRFDSVSLTQTDSQVGGFGGLDPSNIHNLAGKYVAGWGTPFDLGELDGLSDLLDVNAVTHIRLVDVVGIVDSEYTGYDSEDNEINDPFPTPFWQGGFDLDAVGARYMVPEPSVFALVFGLLSLLCASLIRRGRAGAQVG